MATGLLHVATLETTRLQDLTIPHGETETETEKEETVCVTQTLSILLAED